MSDINSSSLLQVRWCNRQHDLINAALDAEDWDNALRLIEAGFEKLEIWSSLDFWSSWLWVSKSRALLGLGRKAEAAEAEAKA